MTQAQNARPVRVGVQLHPEHTSYQSFAEAVKQVEELGVDTIWNWDHFLPPAPGRPRWPAFRGLDAAHRDGHLDQTRRGGFCQNSNSLLLKDHLFVLLNPLRA
jgi:alkanesulfonate monooxygenase SsuD/methylene tetrahydromethanopterin reductase-like flavin-dependent oxidoreductase (luciferase family)